MLAYCYRDGEKPVLEETAIPELSENCKAVVRIIACSICGTDIRTYRFGNSKIKNGTVLGHETVGQIEKISEEWREAFPVGSYVSMAPAIGCGKCRSCRDGHMNMCSDLKTIGFEYDGGFAEYMGIPGEAFERGNLYRIPESEDYTAYVLSEPLACVMNAQSYLRIREGEDVLIIGSGIIGSMHASLSLHKKAGHVMIADVAENRVEEVKKILPKVIGICSGTENLKDKVMEITEGKGADVVIVACSVGSAQAEGMSLLARRGRISLFGGLPGESKGFIDSNLIHYKELSVYGVHASTPEQNKKAMEYIREGIIDAKQLVSAVYPLKDIEDAFTEAEKGQVMKVVITMSQGGEG